MNKAQKFFRALSLARSLSLDYIERLVTILSDEIENVNNIKGIIEDERFSGGRLCPYCNGNRIVRNGHRKGVIQSLCKPPKWCMIYSTPFGGFYYGKKKRRFTTESST